MLNRMTFYISTEQSLELVYLLFIKIRKLNAAAHDYDTN